MKLKILTTILLVVLFIGYAAGSGSVPQSRPANLRRMPRKPALPPKTFPEHKINEETLKLFRKEAFLRETEPDFESMSINHRLYIYARGVPPKTPEQINFGMTVSERQRSVIDLVRIVSDWMNANNLTSWLTHGTLLGSWRDGKIIPWDLDADFGIDYNTYLALNRLAAKHQGTDTFPWGHKDVQIVMRKGNSAHVIPYKIVNTTNGVYLDLLLFWDNKEGGYDFMWPYSCTTCKKHPMGWFSIPNNMLKPLGQCKFENGTYPCPNQVEPFLKAFYGSLAIPKREVRQHEMNLKAEAEERAEREGKT